MSGLIAYYSRYYNDFGRKPMPITTIFLFDLAMSVLTFAVYAHDKNAAQRHRWRIKESTLHSLSLLGGWLGALLAQKFLRHKSSKISFLRVYWLTVVVNVAATAWLIYR